MFRPEIQTEDDLLVQAAMLKSLLMLLKDKGIITPKDSTTLKQYCEEIVSLEKIADVCRKGLE